MGYAADNISECADMMKRMNRPFGSRKKLIVLHALTQRHLLHDQYSVKNPTDKKLNKNDPDF